MAGTAQPRASPTPQGLEGVKEKEITKDKSIWVLPGEIMHPVNSGQGSSFLIFNFSFSLVGSTRT